MREDARKETFEKVTVFDKEMIFTCLRIDRSTIPKGLYMYEIRESDYCDGTPVELCDGVLVNFWGTVISKQPIEFYDSYIGNRFALIGEDDWNYEGETMTLDEYINAY